MQYMGELNNRPKYIGTVCNIQETKYFEIIYEQIRGYACLAYLITKNKCWDLLLDLIVDDQVFTFRCCRFSLRVHVLPIKLNTGKKGNNQHMALCNAQYVCVID